MTTTPPMTPPGPPGPPWPGQPSAMFPGRDRRELVTLSEAADMLRRPIDTLRWWRGKRKGPKFFKLGRQLFTTVGDLEDWVESQRGLE